MRTEFRANIHLAAAAARGGMQLKTETEFEMRLHACRAARVVAVTTQSSQVKWIFRALFYLRGESINLSASL